MVDTLILRRLRSEPDFAERLAKRLRLIASSAWGPDTSHPDLVEQAEAQSPAGQCYVTSMLAAQCLRMELGLEARVALGSLWLDRGRRLAIPFHGWVVVGDPLADPIVFDLTPDQAPSFPPVIAGSASFLAKRGLRYQYQEVRDVSAVTGSVVGRWLALMARADFSDHLRDFRDMAGLDLSRVTDADVSVKLRSALKTSKDDTGRLLMEACLALAEHYSFSETRTYPRPDHPDPRKRRSLSFLLVGILVSLRTTLENEQRAMDSVLAACPEDEDLYSLTIAEWEVLVRPAGMPTKRALSLVRALRYCEDAFGRDFAGLVDLTPDDQRLAVLGIPGVGPKSADCFLSIGLGVPTAVVDVNVFRAYHHLMGDRGREAPNFADPRAVESVRIAIDESLPRDVFLRQIVHTLLLLYGKDRFGKTGSECTAGDVCRSCLLGKTDELTLFG